MCESQQLAHSTRLLLFRKSDAYKIGTLASGCFAVPAREAAACQKETHAPVRTIMHMCSNELVWKT
jgi:hypothetical protein